MVDMKQRQSIIGSDDGLSPGRHQAITCTSVGNCQLYYQEETSAKFKIEINIGKTFLNMSSAKCWSFCLGFKVLSDWSTGLEIVLTGI